jgi:hypothetical protein
MPGKRTRIGCVVGCSIESASNGRRLSSRVLRGGSFNNQAVDVRSANRNRNVPTNRNGSVGFRPARTFMPLPLYCFIPYRRRGLTRSPQDAKLQATREPNEA